MAQEQLAGCSKRPSSKAAGESKPEAYPQGTLRISMNRERSRWTISGQLLNIWNLPINRWQISALKALIDAREAPASEKLPG